VNDQHRVLICSGFHRSATSASANYLSNAGLSLGYNLIGGGISNKGGHFEDWSSVKMHDDWLNQNQTNWQYHDEVELMVNPPAIDKLKEYIATRDKSDSVWAVKDPRICLFLPEWDSVLGERARYLFVLRHWSSCIESLFNRHSRELAVNFSPDYKSTQLLFWQDPTLAAKMWLAYCKRLLAFSRENGSKTLLVTQRALFEGQPLIAKLNTKFYLSLNINAESPLKQEWLNDTASIRIRQVLPRVIVEELDSVWNDLVHMADLKVANESPAWIEEAEVECKYIKDWFSEYKPQDDVNVSRTILDATIETKPQVSATELIDMLNELDGDKIADCFDEAIFNEVELSSKTYLEVYDWCRERYPTSQNSQIAVAFWLQRQGQFDMAIQAWHWCLSLAPTYPYMYYQLAVCYEAINKKELAMYFVSQACDKNPNNAQFWLLKGKFLRHQGEIEEALSIFSRAVSLAEGKPSIILPYCDLLEQCGQLEKANIFIGKLSQSHPDNNGVKNMAIRIALKMNSSEGDALYLKEKQNQISSISTEQRNNLLAGYLLNTGSRGAEEDLLIRIHSFWKVLVCNPPEN